MESDLATSDVGARTGAWSITATLGAAYAVFAVALGTCVLIDHGPAVENAGISWYGVTARTLPLCLLAYGAAVVGLWRASVMLRADGADRLTWLGLRALAVSLVLLLAFPYTAGTFCNWAHMTAGVASGLIEVVMTGNFLRSRAALGVALGAAILLVGGIVAAISLPDWSFQYLLEGEVILEVGFGLALWSWVAARSRTPAPVVSDIS